MNELFLKIVTGSPRQSLQCGDVSTAAYTIVCAQAPHPHDRIKLLKSRLRTSTETSAAQNVYYLANTCVTADLPPDDVENLVEDLVHVVQEHPIWPEFISWVCALIHYYCTDDFTVSLFSEFDVPQVALRALAEFAHQPQLALSANVLLSHFNIYDLSDGIAPLVRVLQLHPSDATMVQAAVRNLAMFTAYCPDAPDRFVQTSREFIEAGGLMAVEALMHDHAEDESIVKSVVYLLDNVTDASHRSQSAHAIASENNNNNNNNNNSNSNNTNSNDDNRDSNGGAGDNHNRLNDLARGSSILISGSTDHGEGGGDKAGITFAMYESDTSTLSQKLAEALSRFRHSDDICRHIVRIFSAIPRSRYIDLHLLSALLTPSCIACSRSSDHADLDGGSDKDKEKEKEEDVDDDGTRCVDNKADTDADAATPRFRSESLMQSGVQLLAHVAMTTRELKPLIQSTGCTAAVLAAMRRWPDNVLIQEQGCSLLSYLSFDSEAITQAITSQSGIVLVLRAIHHHAREERVLVAACAALSGLTFNNPACQAAVIAGSDGIACVLAAMRRPRCSAKLQENGCLALGTLCWNSALKAEVMRQGGVQVVMHALEEHYTCPGVVKNACRALAQVVFNSNSSITTNSTNSNSSGNTTQSPCGIDGSEESVRAEAIIPLILRGMENQPSYDRAQIHGCVALSYLCWTNEDNAAQITANRGYRVVVEAMRNHPHSAEVQEHACRALANINHVSVHESAAALEQIVSAMRRHERVAEVQEEACRAIVTLCLAAAANKDQLSGLGGAEVVLAAMQNFPHGVLVQQEACNAVAYMAYEHVALNRAITRGHGVSLLLTAMREHRGCPKLQLNACGGLSALAFDNTAAQKQIYDLGGLPCIIDAMANCERLRMLELGCSVLGTLAWNAEIKEKVAVVAVPEMVKAMRVHESSALLQKSICRAISQFAFNSEKNRRLLVEVGAIPLIVHAMRTHLTTEKLIAHAVKALTYLCWESAPVAELILAEHMDEVLQRILMHYDSHPSHVGNNHTSNHHHPHGHISPSAKRVLNETIHLSKILFRKTAGAGGSAGESPGASPSGLAVSPPIVSPMVPYTTQTPSYLARGATALYRSPQPPSPSSNFTLHANRHAGGATHPPHTWSAATGSAPPPSPGSSPSMLSAASVPSPYESMSCSLSGVLAIPSPSASASASARSPMANSPGSRCTLPHRSSPHGGVGPPRFHHDPTRYVYGHGGEEVSGAREELGGVSAAGCDAHTRRAAARLQPAGAEETATEMRSGRGNGRTTTHGPPPPGRRGGAAMRSAAMTGGRRHHGPPRRKPMTGADSEEAGCGLEGGEDGRRVVAAAGGGGRRPRPTRGGGGGEAVGRWQQVEQTVGLSRDADVPT